LFRARLFLFNRGRPRLLHYFGGHLRQDFGLDHLGLGRGGALRLLRLLLLDRDLGHLCALGQIRRELEMPADLDEHLVVEAAHVPLDVETGDEQEIDENLALGVQLFR
jgi:hypothetical protein